MKLKINKHFEGLFNDSINNRVRCLLGGAGSGKSYVVTQSLLVEFISKTGINILVCRKTQNSNRSTTFALFNKLIIDLGLTDMVEINKSTMNIVNKINKNVIIFFGLQDRERLKSITGYNGPINRAWIEEASEVLQSDFDQVNLRLRGDDPYNLGFKIYLTLNPISADHWIKKHFFDTDGYNAYTNRSTYLNNVFIDKYYRETLDNYKNTNLDYYNIYCLGEWGNLNSSGKIFNHYVVKDFDYNNFDNFTIGLDFGYNDPNAILLVHYKDDTIYVCREFKKNRMTNAEISTELMNFPSVQIFADSSNPAAINELKILGGHSIYPVKKGPDSIVNGIKWIMSKKLFIHENCQQLIKELAGYCWLQNKDEQYIEKPIDNNNHLIDALRYALEVYMLQSNQKMVADVVMVSDNFGSISYELW